MNVAMVTTAGERCGIAAYSDALVQSLRALPDTDVRIVPIAVGEQPISHYEAQARELNAPDVDVVHVQHEFSFWGFPVPGRPSRFAELRQLIRRPLVMTAHTTLSLRAIFPVATERNPWRWLKKQRLLRDRDYRESVEVTTFRAEATIVHTEAAHQEFIERGLCRERLFVVPTGIPAPPRPAGGGTEFRRRHGLEGKRLLTLFGYVTPNKGYAMVVDVLRHLPPDVVFVVAGGARRPIEEKYVSDLQRYVAQAGMHDRTVITGYLEDHEVAAVMDATDIALVPHIQATGSYSVTFPLSHGKPTLASDLPCFREIAARGNCLELFENGNAVHFRDQLMTLLQSPARRADLAAKASAYAVRFSWPEVAATTRNIYEAALRAGQSTAAAS
jgi:glycosyltransferase involved in cell wall biosynthesis